MAGKRYPGQRPADWQAPGQGGPSPRRLGCGKIALIGVGVLVVLVVIGSMQTEKENAERAIGGGGAVEERAAESGVSRTRTPIKVTPEALRAAFEANEVAAKARYGVGPVRMTGAIEKIILDIADNPALIFRTRKPYATVNAYLDKSSSAAVGALTRGQSVSVVCDSVDEVLSTPILRDCMLLP